MTMVLGGKGQGPMGDPRWPPWFAARVQLNRRSLVVLSRVSWIVRVLSWVFAFILVAGISPVAFLAGILVRQDGDAPAGMIGGGLCLAGALYFRLFGSRGLVLGVGTMLSLFVLSGAFADQSKVAVWLYVGLVFVASALLSQKFSGYMLSHGPILGVRENPRAWAIAAAMEGLTAHQRVEIAALDTLP